MPGQEEVRPVFTRSRELRARLVACVLGYDLGVVPSAGILVVLARALEPASAFRSGLFLLPACLRTRRRLRYCDMPLAVRSEVRSEQSLCIDPVRKANGGKSTSHGSMKGRWRCGSAVT